MTARLLLILSMTAMLIAGCAKPVSDDPAFARKAVDAVYSGSLSSLGDAVSADLQANQAWVKEMSQALQQEFGAVKDVSLKTFEVSNPGTAVRIWTVTAERGSFLMQMMFDKDGKLSSLAFNY